MPPVAAAMFVVTKTCDIDTALSKPVAATVEQGLNPNHPTQRQKTPRAQSARRDLPFLSYFPILGPRTIEPASAIAPPARCTTVEPAKSWNPISESHPPPHDQWPSIG